MRCYGYSLQHSPAFARYALPALLALIAHGSVFFWPTAPNGSRRVHLRASSAGVMLIEMRTAADISVSSGVGQARQETAAGVDRVVPLPDGEDYPLMTPDRPNYLRASIDRSVGAVGMAGGALADDLSSAMHLQCSAVLSRGWGSGVGVTRTSTGTQPLVAPLPPYPQAARLQGRSGIVELVVELNPQGIPQNADVARSSGFEDFDRAAVETVRRYWRFPPRVRQAAVDDGHVRVAVHFNLQPL